MKQYIFTFLLLATCGSVKAQWTIGISDVLTYTTVTRSNACRVDETYSGLWNNGLGLHLSYDFDKPLSVTAGLLLTRRSYRSDRSNLAIDQAYTENSNGYVMLPVMCGIRTQLGPVRIRTMAGGYGAYWIQSVREGLLYLDSSTGPIPCRYDRRMEFTSENRRLTAGVVTGVSASAPIFKGWGIEADVLYYYDLVSHNIGYPHLPDNRYLNSLCISAGITYSF